MYARETRRENRNFCAGRKRPISTVEGSLSVKAAIARVAAVVPPRHVIVVPAQAVPPRRACSGFVLPSSRPCRPCLDATAAPGCASASPSRPRWPCLRVRDGHASASRRPQLRADRASAPRAHAGHASAQPRSSFARCLTGDQRPPFPPSCMLCLF
jgi:hypothetical protein